MNMLSETQRQELLNLEQELAKHNKTLEASSTAAGPKPGYRARCTALEVRIAQLHKERGDKFSV